MMRGCRKLFCSVFAGTLLVAAEPSAQEVRGPNVLILQSLDTHSSPYYVPTQEFRQSFPQNVDSPVSFVEISLDARWGRREDREPYQVAFLRNRFQALPPDLVVGVGPSAIDFWLRYRDEFPSRVPTVFSAREGAVTTDMLRPGDAGIVAEFSFTHVMDEIVTLLPETRHVVVVFGASELERALTSAARSELEKLHDSIEFTFTSSLSMQEIESLLSRLPDRSAVLFGILSIDAGGQVLPFETGLARIVAATNAPVFGVFEHELGTGIVGGRLIPTRRMGKEIATAAHRILLEPDAEPAVRVVPLGKPSYDWRALEAWNIDTALLPKGSEILFRQQTFFSLYWPWVVLVTVVVAAQTVLIVALLIARRRRQLAEMAGEQLSRRLITAHEDERLRLAHELHDDLSQRLAGLAIDAGFLAKGPDADGYREAVTHLHPELVRISKDVHDMSYRLHPSLVDDLGLPTALQSEVDRLSRQAGRRIETRFEQLEVHPPGDRALHLYRIAQQALTNAVQHSDASEIVVSLTPDRDSLRLEVRDDGKGFDIRDLQHANGIGVSSMRERARLAGGTLHLHSDPGKGTIVSVRVPLQGTKR
ncbi:MAG: sensor histidine kinase [Woeseiaceae bacterium]|nr:sensor histidine kinase [Woeseiaceae bacterium]